MIYIYLFLGFYLLTFIATGVAATKLFDFLISKANQLVDKKNENFVSKLKRILIEIFLTVTLLRIGYGILKDIKAKRYKEIFKRYFIYTWIAVMLMIILVPVLWMISVAFTKGEGPDLKGVPIIPDITEWSTNNFKRLFEVKARPDSLLPDYWSAFLRTLLIAVVNTVSVVVVSGLTGVALSRYKFKAKKTVLLTMLGLQMFPSFLAMLAIFFLFRTFGILDVPLALVLIYTAGAVPYNTFIIRGYLRNIPKSLDEAATIDGASNFQLLRHIILPLTVPILGFVAVNAFMSPWMDYILPAQLLPNNQTIAVHLFKYSNPLGSDYDPRLYFSGALFLAVPIMAIQIYMQRFVIGGLMAGADKG